MWQLSPQPLTIKQTIAESYALFKESFSSMYIVLMLFFILFSTPYIAIGMLGMTWVEAVLPKHQIMLGLLFIIYLLLIFWLYGAYYHQLNAIMRKQPASAMYSLRVVLKKLPVLIVAFIIAVITSFIGYIFFIVPGIYLLVVFTLYYPIIVIDDLRPIQALKKILSLVWGNWWNSAAVLILPVLISSLFIVVAGLIILLVDIIFKLTATGVIDVLYIYAHVFLGCLFLPMSATINSMQIHNLKLRKSALHIANQ